jgi:hypothetical protein
VRFHEILYKVTLWFSQTTQPSSSSLFVPAATNTELLPMLWRHHWKIKQMLYAVLNCWGVRQGTACIGTQGVVLMSSMNSGELTVVCGRAHFVLMHSVSF